MNARDLRLVPLALMVWAVALLCVFMPAIAWQVVIFTVCAALVIGAVLIRRQRSRSDTLRGGLAIVLLLAAAATAATVGLAQPARGLVAESGGRVAEVIGEVSSSGTMGKDGRLWFDVHSIAAGAPGAPVPVSAPIRVGVEPRDGLDMGARIRVTGEAAMTDPGERAALVVFGASVDIIVPAEGIFAVAAHVRHDFAERSERLPEPGAGLLPGLAVGDTRAVSPELNAAMLTSGLSHLTAVSGANCAIVVGAVFWLVALCRGGRALRVGLSMSALAAFVVLVTPEPSVIRAAVMAGLAMLTILLGRPSAGLSVLALAVVGILITDPWLSATPGFALSAAASAALIVLAPPLSRGLAQWMPAPLALAIAVPLAAQLACGPIIALFSEQQSLISVAANLLAAPAAPLATVIGLLACLTAPVAPIADVLAASAWLPSAWISMTAMIAAELPGARLLIVPGIGAALLVAVLSVAFGVVLYRDRTESRPRPWLVRGATVVITIAVALGGANMALTGPLAAATNPDGWSVAACDIGQGDAALVRSAGQILLIDTGPDPAALDVCLRGLGIDHIDLLVLTHFDLDHVGGTSAILGRVTTVLHGPAADPSDQRMLDTLASGGAAIVQASAGQRGALGDAAWKVLWPQRDSVVFPSGNDASLVIEISGGDVPRSLFLGDLSALSQRMLMASGAVRGAYSVVKVAHHGSADQDPGLYESVGAAVALFSVGENTYGHPREETLSLLAATGAHVFRTDQQGRILLGIQNDELAVWTEETVP